MMKKLLMLLLILLFAACGPVAPPTPNSLQLTLDTQSTQIAQQAAMLTAQVTTAVTDQATATPQPSSPTPEPLMETPTPTITPEPTATPHPDLEMAVTQKFTNAEDGAYLIAFDNPIPLEIASAGPKSYTPTYQLSALTDNFAIRFEVTLGEHPLNQCLLEFGNNEPFLKTGIRVAGEDERRFFFLSREGNVGYIDVWLYSLNGWRSVQSKQQVPLQFGSNTSNTVIFVRNGSEYTVNVNGQIVTFDDPNPITPGPLYFTGAIDTEVPIGTLACVFRNVQWYIPAE